MPLKTVVLVEATLGSRPRYCSLRLSRMRSGIIPVISLFVIDAQIHALQLVFRLTSKGGSIMVR